MTEKSCRFKRTLLKIPLIPIFLLIGLCIAWGATAIWIDGPATRWLAGLISVLFVIGCLALLFKIRPIRRGILFVFCFFLLVVTWWNLMPPRNDRDWLPDVTPLPSATIVGNKLIFKNVRNFDYRSEKDYTERWETRTYDLEKIRGCDMFLSFWGPTLIAHTIVSWDFDDGQHLAISIETRKEKGEEYSAVKGFFRQFELYYVVADERDVIRLRTNYRSEQVYLYRLRVKPEVSHAVLLDYIKEINSLVTHPKWYNALTHNCTTAIRYHVKHVMKGHRFDWRILANGYIDQLGYERGTIDTSLPFSELKSRSNITEKAKAADDANDFSTLIREGLPGENLK